MSIWRPDAKYSATAPAALDTRATLLDAMPEADLQEAVIAGLRQRGYIVWHVTDSRLMSAGLPDVVAVRLGGPLLLWELKTSTGRVRPAQKTALDALSSVMSVDVRVVRPGDWDVLSERM
jgi:hypothetical protein